VPVLAAVEPALIAELSEPFSNLMRAPRRGPGVCEYCFNLTDGYARCFSCTRWGRWLDAVGPISYSISGGLLHFALARYKRRDDAIAQRFSAQLEAVLWRHLGAHEGCLAAAAESRGFDIVTSVPSSDRARDDDHPLHAIARGPSGVERRFARVLRRSAEEVAEHSFSLRKFTASGDLRGRSVLVIDDTWTTGANAQSAAATLKAAGAGRVAAVVIGRYLTRDWHDNELRLDRLPVPYDWSGCVHCRER
jgi:predicted amidophosphoribosyltransferase